MRLISSAVLTEGLVGPLGLLVLGPCAVHDAVSCDLRAVHDAGSSREV